MTIYRIAKSEKRALDISGMGAYREGGRWNNPGTYMLYTSENSSLCYLENLVHFQPENAPPNLYVSTILVTVEPKLIYTFQEEDYPVNWLQIGCLENKSLGSAMMARREYLGIKVRSAINTKEHNYLLNPLFPAYHDRVEVIEIDKLKVDDRLTNYFR